MQGRLPDAMEEAVREADEAVQLALANRRMMDEAMDRVMRTLEAVLPYVEHCASLGHPNAASYVDVIQQMLWPAQGKRCPCPSRYTGPIEVGMEFTGFGPVRVVNTGHYPASSGDPAVCVLPLDSSYTAKGVDWWMPEAYFRMKALPRAAGENVQEAA